MNESYTESNQIQPTPDAIESILCAAPGIYQKRKDVFYFELRQISINASAPVKSFGIQLCLHNAPTRIQTNYSTTWCIVLSKILPGEIIEL